MKYIENAVLENIQFFCFEVVVIFKITFAFGKTKVTFYFTFRFLN